MKDLSCFKKSALFKTKILNYYNCFNVVRKVIWVTKLYCTRIYLKLHEGDVRHYLNVIRKLPYAFLLNNCNNSTRHNSKCMKCCIKYPNIRNSYKRFEKRVHYFKDLTFEQYVWFWPSLSLKKINLIFQIL